MVDGTAYGLSPYLRMSIATSLAELEEACARLSASLRQAELGIQQQREMTMKAITILAIGLAAVLALRQRPRRPALRHQGARQADLRHARARPSPSASRTRRTRRSSDTTSTSAPRSRSRSASRSSSSRWPSEARIPELLKAASTSSPPTLARRRSAPSRSTTSNSYFVSQQKMHGDEGVRHYNLRSARRQEGHRP